MRLAGVQERTGLKPTWNSFSPLLLSSCLLGSILPPSSVLSRQATYLLPTAAFLRSERRTR